MKRNKQLDILRGIAIILVILQHSLGSIDHVIAKFILSFHMPVFFILSGYLSKNSTDESIFHSLTRKLKKLLIPQITLSVVSLAFNFIVMHKILHKATPEQLNIVNCFFNYWFLLDMAYIVIIWEIFIRILPNKINIVKYILLALCFIYTLLFPQNLKGPAYIYVAPVALGYFIFGNILKEHNSILKLSNNTTLLCICLIILAVLSQINTPVLMYKNAYGFTPIFIVTSILGYFVLNGIATKINHCKFLQWCGENSIIIYVIQFSAITSTRGILRRLLHVIPDEALNWIVFVTALLIILLITKFCKKYLGILFGKTKPKLKSNPELIN